MNGNAFVSPIQLPNRCKCGHDILVHTMTPGANLCRLCIFTGGTQNRHQFANRWENVTATAFASSPIYGYCTPANLSQLATILTNASIGAGSNSVTVAGLAALIAQGIVVPGVTIMPAAPANPGNQAIYYVTRVQLPATLFITPNTLFTIPLGASLLVYGSFGSTMGPALSGNNYQRGG